MKRSELKNLILELIDQSPLDDINLEPLIQKLSEGKDLSEAAQMRSNLVGILTDLKNEGDIWFSDQGLNLTGRQGNKWFNSTAWIRSTIKYEKEKKTQNESSVPKINDSVQYEIEVLENLLEKVNKISYSNKEDFDILKKRAELLMRKFFGNDSHYIEDYRNIKYYPNIIIGGMETDYKTPFESGVGKLSDIIQIMIEDKKLSSNYTSSKTENFIETVDVHKPKEKPSKEVHILIASPGDVVQERELLLHKLETKFRREHYEDRCGTRIIVDGWENIPSQSGYPQDIINSDLVEKANIILAVFRHKLGSPTIDLKTGKDRSKSGTAEELLYAIRNKEIKNPPVGMAYFYANAPVVSLESVNLKDIMSDWERVKEFKQEIKDEILYKSYSHEDTLLDLVCKDICDNIVKFFS